MFAAFRESLTIHRAYREASCGSVDAALSLLRSASTHADPTGGRAVAQGFILFQHQRFREAADEFAKAFAAAPADMMRLHYLTLSLARSDQWDAALQQLKTVAAARPDDIAPPCLHCLLYLERRALTDARLAYEQALKIHAAPKPRAAKPTAYAMGLMEQCQTALAASRDPLAPNPPTH